MITGVKVESFECNDSADAEIVLDVGVTTNDVEGVDAGREDELTVEIWVVDKGDDDTVMFEVTVDVGFKVVCGEDAVVTVEDDDFFAIALVITASDDIVAVSANRLLCNVWLLDIRDFISCLNKSRAAFPVFAFSDKNSVAKPGVAAKSHTFGPPLEDGWQYITTIWYPWFW